MYPQGGFFIRRTECIMPQLAQMALHVAQLREQLANNAPPEANWMQGGGTQCLASPLFLIEHVARFLWALLNNAHKVNGF